MVNFSYVMGIYYVCELSVLGGGDFNDVISIEDCVVFNDRVTDKFERIWKVMVVLPRHCGSIFLEKLWKTIKLSYYLLVPQARFETVLNTSLERYLCATLLSACVGKSAGRYALIILK
jgi:hypothetical protein